MLKPGAVVVVEGKDHIRFSILIHNRMGSVCEDTDDDTWTVHPNTYDIIEVAVVTMPDGGTWKGTEDHSKWVIEAYQSN